MIELKTLTHASQRCLKFKQFLSNKYTNNDPSKKVIMVTHSRFICLSTSKKLLSMKEVNDYPDDSYFAKNCQVISIKI